MSDDLRKLKPFFSGINEDDKEKLDELFNIYKSHFHEEIVNIRGAKLKVKIHPYNPQKDHLPDFYANYYEKFVHLITRKNYKTKRREFQPERAVRIHWIKVVLENYESNLITYFKFKEADGSIWDYFWYKKKNYMVILEKINSEFLLITAFCVDKDNQLYYKKKEMNQIQ